MFLGGNEDQIAHSSFHFCLTRVFRDTSLQEYHSFGKIVLEFRRISGISRNVFDLSMQLLFLESPTKRGYAVNVDWAVIYLIYNINNLY